MKVGDRVTWLHIPKGGYGYVQYVPAYVVKVNRKRVGIAAQKDDGSWAPRWVTPERLFERG